MEKMDRLEHLKLFVLVTEAGNFYAAGKTLNLAQTLHGKPPYGCGLSSVADCCRCLVAGSLGEGRFVTVRMRPRRRSPWGSRSGRCNACRCGGGAWHRTLHEHPSVSGRTPPPGACRAPARISTPTAP